MRVLQVLSSLAAVSLAASAARGATDAVAPAGGGLAAMSVHVDLAKARVSYQDCKQTPCAVAPDSPSVPIAAFAGGDGAAREVTAEVVSVGGGRHVVHVRVSVSGGSGQAWEGVFAAGSPPLFASVTGFAHGEPGERSGVALLWVGEGGAKTLATGDVREDLRICGDETTLLSPRGLDPVTLAWRGASLQRLSAARRDGATRIVASPRGDAPADPPLARLLVAQGASTALGAPAAISDGDPQTTWSEARPGRGAGEFVLMRAPHEVPIARFAIAVAPRAPRPEGAAPRTFYLATDAALFEVTMPEDAWTHPGAAYDMPLPEPIKTSCVALVLDDAYARGNPRPEVTVAELYAYSAFDAPGAGLGAVARALSGGGPRAEAAAGVLKRAGGAGLDAAIGAYPSLDPAGRALAVDVAASSPSCVTSSRLLAPALSDGDEVVREKARAKLEEPHCGRDATPALVAALGSDGTRARASTLLASVAPREALTPLARALGLGSARERAVVRSAFAHAAEAASGAELSTLLSSPRDADARVELLRAAESRLGDARAAADAALERVFSSAPDLRARYLLAAPIAALARAGDPRSEERLLGLLASDPAPMVRARVAELAGGSPKTAAALTGAAKDPEPRVREAALRAVASAKVSAAEGVAIDDLGGDAWTFVRGEAADALAAMPASPASDAALAHALGDKEPSVRASAIGALAQHVAARFAGPIRTKLEDKREDLDVRIAAAHAAGALCDARAVEDLASYAVTGSSSANPDEVSLGIAAIDALAHLHPADLAGRLKAIHAKGARPDAQRAAEDAIAGRGTCR